MAALHTVVSADPWPPDHGRDLAGLSITEAAAALGVSRNAIRQRIRRGTLAATKDSSTWVVHVDRPGAAAMAGQGAASHAHDHGRGPGPDQGPAMVGDAAMVGQLRTENQRLYDELVFLRGELQRKDTIIMTLAQQRTAVLAPAADMPTTAPRRRWWAFWERGKGNG